MKFEERRSWGHWRLEPSGVKTLGYYSDGKKSSCYSCPLYIFGYKNHIQMNLEHYGTKAWMIPKDYTDLKQAIEDLTKEGVVDSECMKYGNKEGR